MFRKRSLITTVHLKLTKSEIFATVISSGLMYAKVWNFSFVLKILELKILNCRRLNNVQFWNFRLFFRYSKCFRDRVCEKFMFLRFSRLLKWQFRGQLLFENVHQIWSWKWLKCKLNVFTKIDLVADFAVATNYILPPNLVSTKEPTFLRQIYINLFS